VGVNMDNNSKKEIEQETYKCQICNRELKNPVDAMTHYLDHGSNALTAINSLIKEQRTGNVSIEDKARVLADSKKHNLKEQEAMVAEEVK
jgi:hypothetical protein